MSDHELLRAYADQRSEQAFATLVERYVNLVFSAARRQVRDPHLAEEVTQGVFLLLARKAPSLGPQVILSGWLLRTTRFTATNALRREARQHSNEQQAVAMTPTSPQPDPSWQQIEPLLDEALLHLRSAERDAIALRFFEKKSFREVGQALGVTDDTAQKRVTRALEKLRRFLSGHGKAVPLATLSSTLLAYSVQAAPPGLAAMVSSVSLAQGGASGLLLALVQETLQALVQARLKWLAWRGGALALVGTFAVLWVQQPTPPPPATISTRGATSVPAASGPVPFLAAAAAPTPAVPPPEAPRLAFRVLDAQTGAPVPDARLTLGQITDLPQRQTNLFTTDRNGFGLLPLPGFPGPSWDYRIEIFRDGYVPKYVSWGQTQGDDFGTVPREHTTKLDRAVRIGGVVRSEGGDPIEAVRVVYTVSGQVPLRQRERPTMMGNYHTELTDAQGQWICTHVPEQFGMIDYRLVHPQYQDVTYGCQAPEASRGSGLPRLPKADFLAGRALMSMKRGLLVAGTVVDEAGHPVVGAKITQDHDFQKPEANQLADGSGRFRFQNARPRKLVLTVQADGYAPEDRTLTATPELEEQRFILSKGRRLRGRVLDETGAPIPKATVSVSPDPANRGTFEWRARTDEQGRFTWPTAPVARQAYSVSASGFESLSGVPLEADGVEHAVTLKKRERRRLRVRARVSDAQTGSPIDSFKVWVAESQQPPGSMSILFGPSFSGLDPRGSGGNGECVYAISSYTTLFLSEVRADGYTPARATNQNSGQGELDLAFELNRGNSITGLVQSAEGQPVPGAIVVLCEGSHGAMMTRPAEFHLGERPGARHTTSDAQGRFSFPPALEVRALAVAHASGYAEVSPVQLARQPLVTLQAWGRLEGQFRIQGDPAGGQAIWLENLYWPPFTGPTVQLRFEVITDPEGRFVIEGLPPGEHKLRHRPTWDGEKSGVLPQSHDTPVVVQAGRTSQITLGGTGRTLRGQIRAPRVARPIDWRRDVHILRRNVPLPAEMTWPQRENFASEELFRQAVLAFRQHAPAFYGSPEGVEISRQQRQYVLRFQANGTFEANDVAPGSYQLIVIPTEPAVPPAGPDGSISFPVNYGRPIGSLKTDVVVAEAGEPTAHTPVDLGTFEVMPVTNDK